jgi:hypothetical protein
MQLPAQFWIGDRPAREMTARAIHRPTRTGSISGKNDPAFVPFN